MVGRLWDAMWPNIFAPSFYTIAAITVSHYKLKKHIKKGREDKHQ